MALSGTTPQTLDLTALAEDFGRAVSFSRVKVLYARVQGSSYGVSATLFNAASNGWSPLSAKSTTLAVRGGCPVLLTHLGAGWTVDGTNKNLLVTPSATQTLELFLAGLS